MESYSAISTENTSKNNLSCIEGKRKKRQTGEGNFQISLSLSICVSLLTPTSVPEVLVNTTAPSICPGF